MDARTSGPVGQRLPLALAISGRIASGKSTLAQGLATELGCLQASFGDYVRRAAAEHGMELTRANLQALGALLVAEDPVGFTRAALHQAGWTEGRPLIVDGLRHIIILDALRRLLHPVPTKVILVTVDDDVRRERLTMRSVGVASQVDIVDAHSTERDVRGDLLASADLIIDGAKPVPRLVAEVVGWISELNDR